MTLDLHKLANTPGYGIAEKTLRKEGKWRILDNDAERIEWLGENVLSMQRLEYKQGWKFKTEPCDYDIDFFREDIDTAASFEAMEAEQ